MIPGKQIRLSSEAFVSIFSQFLTFNLPPSIPFLNVGNILPPDNPINDSEYESEVAGAPIEDLLENIFLAFCIGSSVSGTFYYVINPT